MAVCRVEKNKNYTTMSNFHLRDRNLSNKARGLLSTMLSLPEDWDYTTRGLALICKDGVDSITAQLKELEQYGYLFRRRLRDENGRITDMEYVIYEEPHTASPDTASPDTASPDTASPYTENPDMVKPDVGKPHQGNPAQRNIDIRNTERQNTDRPRNPVNRRNKKDHTAIAVIIGIVVIAVIILLLLRGCGAEGDGKTDATPDTPSGSTGIVYDSNAVEGGWDEADTDKIVESLNEKVDAGMINISMNTSPVFSDGEAAGNLMIVNEGINRYPQIVEITRNDTGEVIYKSGAIPVGNKIEEAKLTVDLPAGVYECTAMFTSIDSDSGASLGCAGAVIHITVLE